MHRHSTQLGIGTIIPDADAFAGAFASEFDRLKGEFEIETNLPFMPSNGLLKHGRRTAVAFADRLVTSVQGMIESVHVCHVVLPPKKYETIKVGGLGGPAKDVPARKFIDSLGPMFSYLTAQSYAHSVKSVPKNTDVRIGSFTSKQTVVWDLLEKLKPHVYWKGDVCDAAIACADLLAFLTDAKLYAGWHKLERDTVSEVWQSYSFGVCTGVYSHANVGICAWYSNDMIDLRPRLASPTVFLSIDELEDPSRPRHAKSPLEEQENGPGEGGGGEPRPPTFREAVKQLDVYNAAVRHAFALSGSFKIFNFREDFKYVRDRDVFVYVGENSQRVGKAIQGMADVDVMSGADLRRHLKKATK